MNGTLLVSIAFSAIAGAVYAYAGLRLTARKVPMQARGAHLSFLAWWFAVAATSMVAAAQMSLYMVGLLPVWLYQTFAQAQVLMVVLALGGLTYYLFFLYTGSHRLVGWVAAYYGALYLLLEALLFYAGEPTAIADNGWTLTTTPAPAIPTWALVAFVVMLLGPEITACVMYAGLYQKAQERTQKYRVALVSTSILVWFAFSLVASITQQVGATWQVLARLLSVAAAAAILVAYVPPAAWRIRWGLRSIQEETA